MFKKNIIFLSIKEIYSKNLILDNGGIIIIKLVKYDKILDAESSTFNNLHNHKIIKSKVQNSKKELFIEEKKFKNYELKMLHKINLNYLHLINRSFDGGSNLDETEFLSKIFTQEELITILKRKDINLKFRTELLIFYRIIYIDFIIDRNKEIDYNSILVNPINIPSEFAIRIETVEYFKFLKDIISIKHGSLNIQKDFILFNNELKNFNSILEKSPYSTNEEILDYLENGLILPLYVFFEKFMSLLFHHKGYDYLSFYELVQYVLYMIKYIMENKKILKKQSCNKPKKDLFKSEYDFFKRIDSNLKTNFTEEEYKSLINDLKEISNPKFEVLNYNLTNQYLEKYFYNLVITPKIKSIKKLFVKTPENFYEYTYNKLSDKFKKLGLLNTNYEKQTLSILIHYENLKRLFSDCPFVENLSKMNMEYNCHNRRLLIEYFFFLLNDEKLSHKYQLNIFKQLLHHLQFDTANFQKEILEVLSKNSKIINFEELVNICRDSLMSIAFANWYPFNISIKDEYLKCINIIKILKYFCEDHNKNFQTILFMELKLNFYLPDTNQYQEIKFFDFMLTILQKIIIISKWDKVKIDTDETNLSFYYDIFNVILELLIEMIQGTTTKNLKSILFSSVFENFLRSIKILLLRDSNNSLTLYHVRFDLINFITAFLEEKNVPSEMLEKIYRIILPNEIIRTIINTMKKLFLNLINDNIIKKDFMNYDEFYFDDSLLKLFNASFYNDDNISKQIQFKFANRLYHYIKLISLFKNEEALNLLNIITFYKEEDLNSIFNNYKIITEGNKEKNNTILDIYENFYIIKFFDEITKKVFIHYNDKIVTVLFTKNPKIRFLSMNTRIEFLEKVSRENQYSKLYGLMESSEYFYDEIVYNNEKSKKYFFFNFFNSIPYFYLEILMFGLNFIVNIFILWLYKKDKQSSNFENAKNIMAVQVFLTVLHGLIIVNWFSSKFFLYKIIDEKRFALEHKIDVKDLNNLQKIWVIIIYSIFLRNEITMFIWNFVLGCIGLSNPNWYYIFCIQLLCVVNLSSTIKNILLSITVRYKQLISTTLVVVLSTYEFSSIAFFYLSSITGETITDTNINLDLFVYEIETPKAVTGIITENRCSTLIYCFLTHLDIGLRSDGGIGYFIPILNYGYNQKYYIEQLIYIVFFFIVCIVILEAAILGIVIDTNAELNEKSEEIIEDKLNVCFICGGNRDEMEKTNINFENHISNDHDIYSYADYMIGLKFADPQECNAVNSYALDLFLKKSIAWIPTFSQFEFYENKKINTDSEIIKEKSQISNKNEDESYEENDQIIEKLNTFQ